MLPKADLMAVLEVADMGVWEGHGVPCADLEASVWLPRGWWMKSTYPLC